MIKKTGNASEKILPMFESLFDSLEVIYGSGETFEKDGVKCKNDGYQKYLQLNSWGVLEANVITFMRGTNKARKLIIVDESQNFSTHAMKTILTRLGEGSKIILLGDVSQIDDRFLNERNNGISYATYKLKGQDFFFTISMSKTERSSLVEKINELL